MTMKLQGPENNGGFTHEGTSYEPDADGCIEVPGPVAPFAFSHGFVHSPVDEPAPAKDGAPNDAPANLAKMNKKQLVAFAKESLGLELDESMTAREMIAAIEAAAEAKTAA
jgi:hypothetical protein